ncbi:variant erythrocyte surface antigen-1 family protein [Babesia divergens]|uniref:Variant erythrocyte surface antigen-1 family protein n=1 Tax=Babesia divergens TaxID=32595 RepID=A0AAD9GBI8_BABDI|nr:variant erythrocyte surface antigen-1 family protein [Babesia divergens]
MYYTDVFVGQVNNIVNLKSALEAELKGSELTDDLKTQLKALASGLGFLAGLPACLCKPKESVKEGLGKIYEELKNFNCNNLKLNCVSCSSNPIPCKCCVIQSIKDVKECPCLKPTPKQDCHCAGQNASCNKVLAGLEACLHLQCLQSDMEDICKCNDPEKCCQGGKCDGVSGGGSCPFCLKLKSNTPVPTTGLGLSPPNPIRLAQRLETFFGSTGPKGSKNGCTCTCGSGPSCCCLACKDCSESCNSECLSKCSSHGSSKECPCKEFCSKIDNIKIASGSSLMRCCDSGKKCHCGLTNSNCQSGSGCCEDKKKSVKCLIRRLVLYFKDLQPNPSESDFSQKCCDLLCVAKTCEFLGDFYGKGDSKEFKKHLEELKHSSPCGHELYRTLRDFLYYCVHMVGAHVQSIKDKINAKGNTCKKCPTGTSSCNCNNKCNGQCKPCDVLLEDSHLMAILTRKFSSSYNSSSATWDLLCSSSKPCSGCRDSSPYCPCQGKFPLPLHLSCDSNPCCPNCDVRKAAKIFLGMLPCLYWGLKIVFDRCKDPLTWPGWQKISMDSNDNPSSDLAKFFFAWGFQTIESSGSSTIHMNPLLQAMVLPVLLENLFTPKSSVNFKNLYENCKIYFTSFYSRSRSPSTSDPSPPKTVREMLLWFYGLRFQKGFKDLLENCKSLCSPFGNSFHPDAFCYYIHTCCFLLPVAVISTVQDSDSAQKAFSSSSEFSKFLYPSDPSALADMLFKYIRKIFAALNFLCIQCGLDKDKAGWRDCYFGQHCQTVKPSASVSSASPSGCQCDGSNIYLCVSNSHSSCSGSSSSSCNAQCPHPLQAFLCHSKPNSDSESYPFGLSGIVPMGFPKENLSSTARDGWSLYHVLNLLCTNGYYPLTRLVQFALCIFRSPPETLGEFFGFFKKFAGALNSGPLKDNFVDWINGEPGSYPGKALQDAVQNLYGSHSGSHPYDLFSLSGCRATKASGASCGPYLYSLTENAYKDFIEGFLDTYLSFVCHSAPKFQSEFQKFHTAAKGKFSSCCSDSSCKSILFCPCALALISSQGFQYLSPNSLNCMDNALSTQHKARRGVTQHQEGEAGCTMKSCSDFIDQLGKVVGKGSPLQKLLDAIDAFIWSIRLPFFFGFLYVWFFVLSYFCYVILIKLDTFHTGSHLHLPRSFKILPSTLFSDASSKLKDLSYFTL